MLEELKQKDKIYNESRSFSHEINSYEKIILQELTNKLKGISYEKAYEIYENLGFETLKFPLKTVNEGVEGVTPDFLLAQNKLITNEKTSFQNFFKELKNELRTCISFDFTVSFIRHSGLQLIINELNDLQGKGVEGRIITSTYLNITEPKALYKLLQFKNLKIRIYKGNGESFHTKAYIFERLNNLGSVIIGSSNISHEALCNGREWNLRLSEKLEPDIFQKSNEEFEKIWNSNETLELTEELIRKYEIHYKKYQNSNFVNFLDEEEINSQIKPNIIQQKILSNLEKMRLDGKNKAIVIAATGTGKTYLSAFDVENSGASKLLFIAHREELLDNGIKTFKNIFLKVNMGKLSQSEKSYHSDFLFATVQSLSKQLDTFERDTFDYIIIDEFHHAAADSYGGILDYFQAKFMLGLTATPERMDGKDVIALCDYNIAGEIRLREALEYELLAPFHYFGISDELIDYNGIRRKNGRFEENDLSEKLSVNERVNFIIEKIRLYDYNGDKLRSIGFCVDINHAIKMSKEFNLRGFQTAYITSKESMERRKSLLESFRKGELEIIFTVDIFNEGIDIPEINMLLFLRPTESSTIFTQQLGRGLRKIAGKNYVTVLDFIGNYNKEFLLPQIFMPKGQNKNDIGALKNEVLQEFHNLPRESFVELDRICQKRVLDTLEKIKINSNSYILSQYEEFKNNLGRIPDILDFLYSDLDLSLIIKSFGTYAKFLKKVEKIDLGFDEYNLDMLEKLEKKLPIKWWYEFLLLDNLFDKNEVSIEDLLKEANKYFDLNFEKEFHKELILNLTKELGIEFINFDGKFVLNAKFKKRLENKVFYKYLKDLLKYGLIRYKKEIKLEAFKEFPLVKYTEYSRVELQYLLQSTAEKGSWRAGYSVSRNNICLFITLNKDAKLEEHLQYDNFFRGQDIVQWISQNKTSQDSPIGKLYRFHKEKGYIVHLFIRKYSTFLGSAMNFNYMGQVDYYSSHGDRPMYILWKLRDKIPNEIYVDLEGN